MYEINLDRIENLACFQWHKKDTEFGRRMIKLERNKLLLYLYLPQILHALTDSAVKICLSASLPSLMNQ